MPGTADQLISAIKRTPGNIAGGPVDIVNLIAGLAAGKGVEGLSKEPIGGSDWINRQFGMKDKGGGVQQVAEMVAGMASPGAAAKAIIIPIVGLSRADKILGVESAVQRALQMKAEGKTDWAIGVESERALKEQRNPGGAFSVFIGPDGNPRIKVDSSQGRLTAKTKELIDPTGGSYVDIPKTMQAGANTLVGPEVPLSDIYLHPSLYDISPAARTATVQHNSFLDLFGASGTYNASTNTIQIPSRSYTPARMKNDPRGYLEETLLHESTHVLQAEAGVRGGSSPKIEALKKSLEEAKTKGSFRTPEQLKQVEDFLGKLEKMPDSAAKDAALQRLYMNVYGEWEARQGSQYGRSLPMMNERGSTF